MATHHDDDADETARPLPLLPLRDIIIFPHMMVPLFVGRQKSILALDEAHREGGEVLLCAQKRAKTNDPRPDEIYAVGTVGVIRQLLRLQDGTVKVLVDGRRRARILSYVEEEPFFRVEVEDIQEPVEHNQEVVSLMRAVRTTLETYVQVNKRVPSELLTSVATIDDPARLADTLVPLLSLKLLDKQRLLETEAPVERLTRLFELMKAEIEVHEMERKIRNRSRKSGGKEGEATEAASSPMQKEFSGERDEFKNELEELEERIRRKPVPPEAEDRLKREFKKLRMMSPMSAEASVVRNYIDWILSLPWYDKTEEDVDLKRAEETLDADHYGLEKPKERILEYLAVHKLVARLRGPVLCLVGPPGVGKTSLARSIASSINRKFVRLSLGGVRDEAEVRGHRRTYIGALPGKIVQSLKKVGSNNPVMLLDEIDKMSTDFRGDPSSALLEVLDPEQNAAFNDHYLDLDYDLSEVMFITTANNISAIPPPLRDRMEVIEIPGYTEFEKLQISRQHLVARQKEQNGLADLEVTFSDAAIKAIINGYTREAGVRSLERQLGGVCRKIARDVVTTGAKGPFRVTPSSVTTYLGPARFEDDVTEDRDEIGLTNGLAWTMYGGVLLTAEVSIMPGNGKLIITGKLGDVMQESAQAAMTYVRSRALNLGLAPDFYQKVDLHVHFPEGAAPKDGPSAGITMVTSLVSALTRIPVRRDVAMTGEITLRGRVLAIGGLKEKILAAHRAGVKTVVIPMQNKKDLRDVPAPIRRALEIIPVSHVDDVLKVALQLDDPAAFMERLTKPLIVPSLVPGATVEPVTGSVLTPPSTTAH